jgi:hypothetical protein
MVDSSLSPAVTRMIGLVGAMVSFEEGAELLTELVGVRLNSKQVARRRRSLDLEPWPMNTSPMLSRSLIASMRRAFPSAGKVIAMAAAFVLLGYGGLVTFAHHSAEATGDATAPVASLAVVDKTAMASEKSPSASEAAEAQNNPRECDAAKGISSNCVFE